MDDWKETMEWLRQSYERFQREQEEDVRSDQRNKDFEEFQKHIDEEVDARTIGNWGIYVLVNSKAIFRPATAKKWIKKKLPELDTDAMWIMPYYRRPIAVMMVSRAMSLRDARDLQRKVEALKTAKKPAWMGDIYFVGIMVL